MHVPDFHMKTKFKIHALFVVWNLHNIHPYCVTWPCNVEQVNVQTFIEITLSSNENSAFQNMANTILRVKSRCNLQKYASTIYISYLTLKITKCILKKLPKTKFELTFFCYTSREYSKELRDNILYVCLHCAMILILQMYITRIRTWVFYFLLFMEKVQPGLMRTKNTKHL